MSRLERAYPDLSRPLAAYAFTVNAPEEGARLDLLLRARYPWRSRTRFQGMLERGDVTVNGGAAKASQRVRRGDRVAVRIPADPTAPAKEHDADLVVLYEDDAVVAVDKPSGMTVHPVGRIRHGTLINKLHARYRREQPEGTSSRASAIGSTRTRAASCWWSRTAAWTRPSPSSSRAGASARPTWRW